MYGYYQQHCVLVLDITIIDCLKTKRNLNSYTTLLEADLFYSKQWTFHIFHFEFKFYQEKRIVTVEYL